MREIKFRAWCNASGLLIDGDVCFGYDDFDWVVLDDERNHLLSNYGGTLEQYTGLKDKNGVEIYEGDVVSGFSGEVVGEIIFGDEDAAFFVMSRRGGGLCCQQYMDNFEVIGNINQTPELIEAP